MPSVVEKKISASVGRAARGVYSVINLGPEAGAAVLLNERGQAAFGSIGYPGISNGFFDGDRVHDLGSLGGSHTWVWGLNKHGTVVGESEDGEAHSNILAFSWTVGGGMRALAGTSVSSAHAINDKRYIVGLTSWPDVSARAMRWNPDGTVTALGPLPLSLSQAFDINKGGISTGFTDMASGAIHATQWDRAGTLTDLGTLGGARAFGMHINESDAVAGEADNATNDRVLGFFWSRGSGMVPINVEGGGSRLVSGLNNRGEVVGAAIASVSGKGALSTGVTLLGRHHKDVPLRFALWAPLGTGKGDTGSAGSAVVILSGPFHFRSDKVTTATAAGQQARLEGTGRLNGRPGYRFLLDAADGGGKQSASQDRLRVRVTHLDAITGIDVVDYDNGVSATARASVAHDHTVLMEGRLRLRP